MLEQVPYVVVGSI